jgi:hypothetical protein
MSLYLLRSTTDASYRYGPPRDLYNRRGQFYDMVYHSGEMDGLEALLQAESCT